MVTLASTGKRLGREERQEKDSISTQKVLQRNKLRQEI
jgi:hypothetical protein